MNGLYQTELAALAQEPVNGNPSAVSMRHMAAETRRRLPEAWTPDGPTWVWSDLHLHHRNIIHFHPLRQEAVRELRADGRALHGVSRQTVGDDECMRVIGGVTHNRVRRPGPRLSPQPEPRHART